MTILRIALAGLFLSVAAGTTPAMAQTTPPAQSGTLSFDDLKQDNSLPLEIDSDELEVNQAAGTAIFRGDVVVTQGDMRLSAKQVEARYAEGTDGAQGRLTRLSASGGVLIAAGQSAIEAREAVYNLDRGELLLTGNVVLTQLGNTLSGQRLTVDVNNGTGRMEGRVRTVLQTGGSPRQ